MRRVRARETLLAAPRRGARGLTVLTVILGGPAPDAVAGAGIAAAAATAGCSAQGDIGAYWASSDGDRSFPGP